MPLKTSNEDDKDCFIVMFGTPNEFDFFSCSNGMIYTLEPRARSKSVLEIISLRNVDFFSVPNPEKKINFLIEGDCFISSINFELNCHK